jgi:hypothetical protein
MLYEFAGSIKGHLKSYLPSILTALLALVTDKHSSDARSSACLALAKTFEAYVHAAQCAFVPSHALADVLSACLNKLLESLRGEIQPTCRACAAEALKDVLAGCYGSGQEQVDGSRTSLLCRPDEATALEITKEVVTRCRDSIGRRQEKEAAFHKNEGLEAEDMTGLAEELEEEDELLTNLADALGQLLKLFGEGFMPVFDQLVVPVFAPYLAPEQPAQLQIVAVCVLDDAIEFGGATAYKYIPQALATFARGMASDHPVLRQSSVYGIAQSARKAPEIFAQHMSDILPRLTAIVTDPAAKEEDNEGTTENALYALGTLCATAYYRNAAAAASWGGVPPSQAASLWLRGLPLRADEQEAKQAHRQLCDAVESGDTAVTGDNYSNLPHLLRIFAEVLGAAATAAAAATVQAFGAAASHQAMPEENADGALAHPATVERMQGLLRQLSTGLAPEQMQAAFVQLSSEQQQALRAVV